MLGIEQVREEADAVKDSITARGQEEKLPLVQDAIKKHDAWKEEKGALDELRRQRNEVSEAINKAKKAGKDAKDLIAQAKKLPDTIKKQESLVEGLQSELNKILTTLPNILDENVPEGAGEEQNAVIEQSGKKPSFSFEIKNHVELAEGLGIADFEAARKTSGAGFFFLIGDLALLDQALQRYALDVMLEEGFTPVVPPYMIRKEIVDGVVDAKTFEELQYKVEDEDLYPIATSEHPLIGMYVHADIDERDLPVTLCGISPCFRKELGAHGIDEKGLFRTHQFHKVEQVVICKPEESAEWYNKLLAITKKIFTGLNIPWQELEMCAGDLGDLKARQADLEAWSPRRQAYFEVGSCSNLTAAQARRLNIRSVSPEGEREYVHTLNNTALATSRAMVAILENNQQEDGSVTIPEVLHKYMNGKQAIGR